MVCQVDEGVNGEDFFIPTPIKDENIFKESVSDAGKKTTIGSKKTELNYTFGQSNRLKPTLGIVDKAESSGYSMPRWCQTLQFGLDKEGKASVSLAYPFTFMVRRIVYAFIILACSNANVIFGAYILLLSCFLALTLLTKYNLWELQLINAQHIMNEASLYLMVAAIMAFSGAVTDSLQASAFGWLFVSFFMSIVIFNVVIIAYETISYCKLLLMRYYVFLPRRVKSLVYIACCCQVFATPTKIYQVKKARRQRKKKFIP